MFLFQIFVWDGALEIKIALVNEAEFIQLSVYVLLRYISATQPEVSRDVMETAKRRHNIGSSKLYVFALCT